ncbi:metallophosphoesterase [uncultured Amnibacterium sp.]|uniref:metallophosphoesterase n=1 Tax=uncultured Amnibacterium sp. TaxID=1631851 RepID=UPI0035CC292E
MTREPIATHRIGHVSDSHFTASDLMHGTVRVAATYSAALAALEGSGIALDALVHTGDVADDGEPQAYLAAGTVTRETTARTGWPVLWAVGNHDVRAAMAEHLLGEPPTEEPLDRVVEVAGLRLVSLDTSIPQHVEGGIDPSQADWLRSVLSEPAEHGTVLALHHPPLPVEVTAMARLHLTGQDRLAAALAGSDVRAILGGHLHYATSSSFAGVPVHVAPSTAYTIRLTRPAGGVIAVDGARAAGVLSLYDDGRVGYSALPADPQQVLASTAEEVFLTMGVDVEH